MNREEVAKELEQISNQLRKFSELLEDDKNYILESSKMLDCVVANLMEALSKDEQFELSKSRSRGYFVKGYYYEESFQTKEEISQAAAKGLEEGASFDDIYPQDF